ncbi:hypothetical protein ACS0TY_024899 [Phlomoides rotata]
MDEMRQQIATLTQSVESLCVQRAPPLFDTHAEQSFSIEIPEFTGSGEPTEFLDWISAIEEILDFTSVPNPMRLVATCLRG